MKTKIFTDEYGKHGVYLPLEALKLARVKPGDTVIVDIPMTGDGISIRKQEGQI